MQSPHSSPYGICLEPARFTLPFSVPQRPRTTRPRLEALLRESGSRSLRLPAYFALALMASLVPSAQAQAQSPDAPERTGRIVLAAEPGTDAEAAVQAQLEEPGLHVVHFWAPWCGNSRAELRGPHSAADSLARRAATDSTALRTWADLIAARPDVQFTFVTVYNDGEAAAEVLVGYGIDLGAPNFTLLAQPDLGPSHTRHLRRRTFLGLPVTWTPTTWVFHRSGMLAYAFNYGEVAMPALDGALRDAAASWAHD